MKVYTANPVVMEELALVEASYASTDRYLYAFEWRQDRWVTVASFTGRYPGPLSKSLQNRVLDRLHGSAYRAGQPVSRRSYGDKLPACTCAAGPLTEVALAQLDPWASGPL